MYYFYAIRSLENQSIYKGISRDPVIRLNQHNSGRTSSTRPHRPYELVYVEACADLTEARTRELYYKTGSGREDLKIKIME